MFVKIVNLLVPLFQVIIDLITGLHEGPRVERASAWEHRNCLVHAGSGGSSTLLCVAVGRHGGCWVVCVLLGLFAGGLFRSCPSRGSLLGLFLTLNLRFLHHGIKIFSESLLHLVWVLVSHVPLHVRDRLGLVAEGAFDLIILRF